MKTEEQWVRDYNNPERPKTNYVKEISDKFIGGSGDKITLYDAEKFAREMVAAERERIKNGVIKLRGGISTAEYGSAYYNAAYNKIIDLIDSL